MLAVADQNTDSPVDGRKLGQPGHPGSQRAWRQIGIEVDSPIGPDLAVPLIIAVWTACVAGSVSAGGHVEGVAEVGREVDEGAGGGGVQSNPAFSVESGPRTVSGSRTEVFAVRWDAIRVSVTGCPLWPIVICRPR